MGFDVTADAYGRFMGRFSEPLAAEFVALLDPEPPQRALDVGCGPGTFTAALVERIGEGSVAAVDPSPSFVSACQARFPGADVRRASAERLPFEAGAFDMSLANLVVHFMADPVAGVSEMARVSRSGGVVGATVWDHSGDDTGPLSLFWRAVRSLQPGHPGESLGAGAQQGALSRIFHQAGLTDVEQHLLKVRTPIASFDDWWEPYTYGVGPAGEYVAALPEDQRARLRERCAELLPEGPFELPVQAWCAVART